jgi:outer membrane protein assembly factor BamB
MLPLIFAGLAFSAVANGAENKTESAPVSYPPLDPAQLPGKGAAEHPFLYAGEWDTRKPQEQSMFLVRAGQVVWRYTMPLKNAIGQIQEFDDATLLSDGNIIFSHMSGASMVNPEHKIVWDYPAPAGTEIHSIQSIGRDRVLLMRNGNPAQAMIINTATGQTEKEIPIPTTVPNTHGQFRHIRMTPANTILVPHLSEGKVVEYDLTGKVLWSVQAANVWSAIRLKNGHTLLAGDARGYAREVNAAGETVWEFTQADVPFKLYNVQTAQRLANGHTVLCCWCAGNNHSSEWPGTVQVLEVTAEKKIVWALSSWTNPDLGPATSIQLLDEPGVPEMVGQQQR